MLMRRFVSLGSFRILDNWIKAPFLQTLNNEIQRNINYNIL
jgi:hypothetical protein